MDRKKEIKDELENLSPFLAEMKKKNSYKVPENYFAELSANVWEEVQKEKVSTQPTPVATTPNWMEQVMQSIAVLFQPRMALSLASVAVLLVAGIFWMNNNPIEVQTVAEGDGLTIEETTNYLAENIDDFDTDLLMQIELEESDITDIYDYDQDFEDEDLDAILDDLLKDINEDNFDELL